jgi:hypothetical protein
MPKPLRKILADKAATLPGLKSTLARLKKEKLESEGASKEELEQLLALTKEQVGGVMLSLY